MLRSNDLLTFDVQKRRVTVRAFGIVSKAAVDAFGGFSNFFNAKVICGCVAEIKTKPNCYNAVAVPLMQEQCH